MLVWLQQGWACSELKPPALWQRWEFESDAIYVPLAQRNLMLVFPTEWGGLERWSGETKKKKGKRWTYAQVWRGSLRLASCMSVFLGTSPIMLSLHTCHPVCSASHVNSNCWWKYRKTSKKCEETAATAYVQSHAKTQYHLSTQTHIRIGHVWSHLCVAQSKGQRGQDFQMFPIIPQYCRTFLVTILSVSHFLESRRMVKSWLTYWPHYSTVVFTANTVWSKKSSSFQNGKPSFLWVWRKIPHIYWVWHHWPYSCHR